MSNNYDLSSTYQRRTLNSALLTEPCETLILLVRDSQALVTSYGSTSYMIPGSPHITPSDSSCHGHPTDVEMWKLRLIHRKEQNWILI